MNVLKWLDNPKHWWRVFVIIFSLSISVVGYLGYDTYQAAPPIVDFVSQDGKLIFAKNEITEGQKIFLKYGLMEYGSYLGDGGMRGPDFTAEGLNATARYMNQFYYNQEGKELPMRVRHELKTNTLDLQRQTVTLNPAQVHAYQQLVVYYRQKFTGAGELVGKEIFKSPNYITDAGELQNLTAFIFWGSWFSAAQRPGENYSYTHNWPFDPLAGNTPTAGIFFWSIVGIFTLFLTLGIVLYYYGKMDRDAVLDEKYGKLAPISSVESVDSFIPLSLQTATFKFFVLAMLLFLLQITFGLLTISDFVDILPLTFTEWLPVTITRAFHTQISVLWIATCWFGASLFLLPFICNNHPKYQHRLINLLFGLLVLVSLGTVIGIPLGMKGLLGQWWYWLGSQGWEYMQIGRVFQYLLFSAFCLWLIIVVRALMPLLKKKQTWSLPNWMVYTIAGCIFMFTASFVADPETNFVVADFWRWCTIHMWVEAFFELFTTILVAYFLYYMGFVGHMVASRVVYLGAVLFLGSGLIGISHNFYWNGKSIETVALGSVFSTLQFLPLILLSLETWKFKNLPRLAIEKDQKTNSKVIEFGMNEPFLFLIGVNFWNFVGAGLLGFIINLPIVNYYQHGTYLTVNHGHAALFGVYGNLAIASVLFCTRWMIKKDNWNPKLLRLSFWSLNGGLFLMVVFDLFPIGLHQLMTVIDQGYAFARSQVYLDGAWFQNLTWVRGIGAAIFVITGVLPLIYFVLKVKLREELNN